MKPGWKGHISDQEAAYIRLQLDHVDPKIKESGLERLCSLYRAGFRFRVPHEIRQLLNALLYNPSENVRRWALNSIALVGTRVDNLQATLDAVNRDRANSDILGAGIAALVSLTGPDDLPGFLHSIDIPLEGAPLLAAAQQTEAFHRALGAGVVDPDKSAAPELRLASVLVGLRKAPENLFSRDHPNSAVIGALNRHDDRHVAQYSVWAICESDDLGLSHLGISLPDIERLPANVRGWVYQLIASNESDAQACREYLLLGSADTAEDGRQGVARGLFRTYFDGLQEITLDWLGDDVSSEVRALLLDHMAANVVRCPAYRDSVITAYTAASSGSLARSRLEAAAQGMPIYPELRRISIQSDNLSLFPLGGPRDGTTVMNFKGKNINVGVVAGRDAKVGGDVNLTQKNVSEAKKELGKLSKLIEKAATPEFNEGKLLVDAAKKKPSQSTVGKVLGWMKALKAAGAYGVAASDSFMEIAHKIEAFLPHLPQ